MLYSDLTNEAIMFTDLVLFIPVGYYLITQLTGGIIRAVAGEAENDFLENMVCFLIGLIAIYGVMVLGSFNVARSLPRILLKDMPESSAVFSRWQERTKNSAVNVVVVDGETGQEIKLNLLNISEEMGLLHGGDATWIEEIVCVGSAEEAGGFYLDANGQMQALEVSANVLRIMQTNALHVPFRQ
ncbi:hypothetical protein [uncultured Subdoligranulum sp.]|uniref:hypothetical protein n=1 Tax=uncultured Subdoligranulum sp. TaxID=512298 RepID=UPI003208471B